METTTTTTTTTTAVTADDGGHGSRPNHPSSSSNHVFKPYKCSFCDRGFSNAQALGGHMNVHRKDRANLNNNLYIPASLSSSQSTPVSSVDQENNKSDILVGELSKSTSREESDSVAAAKDGNNDDNHEVEVFMKRQLPLFVETPSSSSSVVGCEEDKKQSISMLPVQKLDLELRLGREPDDDQPNTMPI